jgi:hypothetical protein
LDGNGFALHSSAMQRHGEAPGGGATQRKSIARIGTATAKQSADKHRLSSGNGKIIQKQQRSGRKHQQHKIKKF